jgi:alanine racemase
MQLVAPVVLVREVPAGTPVGYGGSFVTTRPARIGVCPIGYADGLPRAAEVLSPRVIHGKTTFSVPVAGHICMDQTMLDLTGTPAAVGDTVVFLSDPRPIAAACGTIPYEILTAVSRRVKRIPKELYHDRLL